MIILLFILASVVSSHRLIQSQSLLIPSTPAANSQAYLRSNNVSSYSIHLGNQSSCRFKASVIPCECIKKVSDQYWLEEHGTILTNFSVVPPEILVRTPSNHELLQELVVHFTSKLCQAELFEIRLQRRPLETAPGEEVAWHTTSSSSITLHKGAESFIFPCQAFADIGYYQVVLLSQNNYSVTGQSFLVNHTTEYSLSLRNDSIFPHCSSQFDISWAISKCPLDNLHYRIRIFAVPEGSDDHEDRVHYIEEVGVTKEQKSISISCSHFDIIYDKYCFELVSINRNSSTFQLWKSSCVSTEPVLRQNGGWSEWSDWSACSATCGSGKARRSRTCDNPVPIRGKSCVGDVMETRDCLEKKCPLAANYRLHTSNCSCGCELNGEAGSFFATASVHDKCFGNQTWYFIPHNGRTVIDISIQQDEEAEGKLFFFLRKPYGELVWFSGSNHEPDFTLRTHESIYIVLWSKPNSSRSDFRKHKGFTVIYTVRGPEQPIQLPARPSLACHPVCPETVIISLMGILFLLIIFIPPFICAGITQRIRRNSSPELPLIDQKYENEMIRSGNTECTHVSSGGKEFIARRSIGIQLSVQNTPRLTRTCPSADSPLPRGMSSLSTSDELEYDYYDGTTIPGSLLAPIQRSDELLTEIDIDQIIRQSQIFTSSEVVCKQDVHTQI
ncbi:unnamed protein product [Auanema sp. JU1783]|nr:unnamed protein product [Auanema sp. JU1783]